MKKILINAMNLHGGGGVAVATSFIHNLSSIYSQNNTFLIDIAVSTVVHENLVNMEFNSDLFNRYEVEDVFGAKSLLSSRNDIFSRYDVVFTVFGPLYSLFRKASTTHIIGFAQPWIAYPKNDAYKKLSIFRRNSNKFKFFLQNKFFKKADLLVVELQHVKNALVSSRGFNSEKIAVVNSCVDRLYFNKNLWSAVSFDNITADFKLGVISRNYVHKNLSVIPAVKKLLQDEYGLNVIFYVTFSDEEYKECNVDFVNATINIGQLTLSQCPSFYQHIDGVFFPTLLECFSATPIEAMAMRKPLFVSNRPFIYDCCGDDAIYVDPLSPIDIANKIYNYINYDDSIKKSYLDSALLRVGRFSDSKLRAKKYLDLICSKL